MQEIGPVPLPPASMMMDLYGSADYQGYWESGHVTARRIAAVVSETFTGSTRPLRVLDWGCGPARVVRHLRGEEIFREVAIDACDYNPDFVAWGSEHLKEIRFARCALSPPLPYADGQFDVIYAISVITPLSAEIQRTWARELFRVLAPGGILLLTFQGDAFRKKLLPDEARQFDAGAIVVRSGVVEGSRMYCAFQSESSVHRLLVEAGFEMETVLADENSIAPPQDTARARKPRQSA